MTPCKTIPSQCHVCLSSFTNAVLTDITESLFSAIKQWVYGKGTLSPTLFMAIVRIINGFWRLLQKPYLRSYQTTKSQIMKWIKSPHPSILFSIFAKKLTAWATTHMLNIYRKHQLDYDIVNNVRGGTGRSVRNKKTGDRFLVTSDFSCTLDNSSSRYHGKKCWQQTYTGVLCIHAIIVCVDRISRTMHRQDKLGICYDALKACNRHWYRATYGSTSTSTCVDDVQSLPNPIQISRELIIERNSPLDESQVQMKKRFGELLSLCKSKSVYIHLQQLESEAVSLVGRGKNPVRSRLSHSSRELRYNSSCSVNTSSPARMTHVNEFVTHTADRCDTPSSFDFTPTPTMCDTRSSFDFTRPPVMCDFDTRSSFDFTRTPKMCDFDTRSSFDFTRTPEMCDTRSSFDFMSGQETRDTPSSCSSDTPSSCSSDTRSPWPVRTSSAHPLSETCDTPSSCYSDTPSPWPVRTSSARKNLFGNPPPEKCDKNLKSIEDVSDTPFARPARRCKNKQKSDSVRVRASRPRRKRRHPNKGSIADECREPQKAKTTKIKDLTKNKNTVVHDAAISRVIGSKIPSVEDFSTTELICIIKHLQLKPIAARKKVILCVCSCHP